MTEIQILILSTLAGQSPGYLVAPNASAFFGCGLTDPELVERQLVELETLGFVALLNVIETVPPAGEGGDPFQVVVDVGWEITTAGRDAIATV